MYHWNRRVVQSTIKLKRWLPIGRWNHESLLIGLKKYHPPRRCFNSTVSATGFNDYELDRKRFRLEVPEYFNFATDVLDNWAEKEQNGTRKSRTPAFWWIDDEGNQLKWSFLDLKKKSQKASNVLREACGLSSGERILLLLPRLPEWWLLKIACLRTGTVVIPGATQLTEKDIRDRLLTSGASCIITDPYMAPKVDQVIGECPNVRSRLLVPHYPQKAPSRPDWLDWSSLYENASEEFKAERTRSDQPMMIFFTSGTTGSPKMVQHTHASYGLGHIITGRYWLDLTPVDVHWNLSDTGWAKSTWSSFFAPWTQGSCVFVHHTPRFEPIRTLQVLEEYPITTFCTAPTAYRFMIHENLRDYNLKGVRHCLSGSEPMNLKDFNLKGLRHCVSAGEPLNPEVIEAWRRATGLIIREGYGQTETTLLCGSFRCLEPRPGSMGKPAPGYDMHVVDDRGQRVSKGSEGNLGIRVKPHRPVGLFTHYIADEERTAASFKGDYYLTGDRMVEDQDGYLWFVGRSDDVIISAGYRIGPFEVESALIEHPAVAESAVVSSPDPKARGQVVKAFIVLAPSYQELAQDGRQRDELIADIQEHVKKSTAPYKYPRKIEFVEHLPKTISGKIRRIELRNLEWKNFS